MKKRQLIIAAGMLGLGTVAAGQSLEGEVVGVEPAGSQGNVYRVQDVESGLIFQSNLTQATFAVGDKAEYVFVGEYGNFVSGSNTQGQNMSKEKVFSGKGNAELLVVKKGKGSTFSPGGKVAF